VALGTTGKPEFNQLTLPAEVGQGYTVSDQAWYDPATGRFVRLLRTDNRPIFANSYDGKDVCLLDVGADGALQVVRRPASEEFRRPKSPAEFLGIAAGLRSRLGEKNEDLIRDEGEVMLDDGSKGRVVRVSFAQGGPEAEQDAYCLFTIRENNNTITQMELIAQGQSLLVVRRVKTETVTSPAVAWDLAGIEGRKAEAPRKAMPGIMKGMVIPNVPVEHMVAKADFATYVFSPAPAWAPERQITDILDVASPPHRMFGITYRAKDGRHVVLVQSPSYNKMLGPMAAKTGKVIYTSPSGIKVLSGPRDKWLAGILLQSSRAAIKDPPSNDRTGYLLETPEGTFPALAVNGRITDEELHGLIDSLVPAKRHNVE
jgi:hypothetical protein